MGVMAQVGGRPVQGGSVGHGAPNQRRRQLRCPAIGSAGSLRRAASAGRNAATAGAGRQPCGQDLGGGTLQEPAISVQLAGPGSLPWSLPPVAPSSDCRQSVVNSKHWGRAICAVLPICFLIAAPLLWSNISAPCRVMDMCRQLAMNRVNFVGMLGISLIREHSFVQACTGSQSFLRIDQQPIIHNQILDNGHQLCHGYHGLAQFVGCFAQ